MHAVSLSTNQKARYKMSVGGITESMNWSAIRPCQTAAILSRETRRALFYHGKPRSGNHGAEAWRGKTKLFWFPGTIWPPYNKGEWAGLDWWNGHVKKKCKMHADFNKRHEVSIGSSPQLQH